MSRAPRQLGNGRTGEYCGVAPPSPRKTTVCAYTERSRCGARARQPASLPACLP